MPAGPSVDICFPSVRLGFRQWQANRMPSPQLNCVIVAPLYSSARLVTCKNLKAAGLPKLQPHDFLIICASPGTSAVRSSNRSLLYCMLRQYCLKHCRQHSKAPCKQKLLHKHYACLFHSWNLCLLCSLLCSRNGGLLSCRYLLCQGLTLLASCSGKHSLTTVLAQSQNQEQRKHCMVIPSWQLGYCTHRRSTKSVLLWQNCSVIQHMAKLLLTCAQRFNKDMHDS